MSVIGSQSRRLAVVDIIVVLRGYNVPRSLSEPLVEQFVQLVEDEMKRKGHKMFEVVNWTDLPLNRKHHQKRKRTEAAL